MIKIEADFKNFDELLVFAQKLAGKGTGTEESTQEEKGSYAVPTQPTYTAPTQTVPTSAPTYTPDDLARAAMTLMDSGRQQELIGLLQSFGVSSLPELKPEQYGPFATALRGMGAQI